MGRPSVIRRNRLSRERIRWNRLLLYRLVSLHHLPLESPSSPAAFILTVKLSSDLPSESRHEGVFSLRGDVADEDVIKFSFGERVFSAADLLAFPRPQS